MTRYDYFLRNSCQNFLANRLNRTKTSINLSKEAFKFEKTDFKICFSYEIKWFFFRFTFNSSINRFLSHKSLRITGGTLNKNFPLKLLTSQKSNIVIALKPTKYHWIYSFFSDLFTQILHKNWIIQKLLQNYLTHFQIL